MKPTSEEQQRRLNRLGQYMLSVPWTPERACRLLYRLVLSFSKPQVIEVSCCFGKATVYLTAAAAARGGVVHCVDLEKYAWADKTVEDRIRETGLSAAYSGVFNCDARWFLLDLFRRRTGKWVNLAYLDAAHTVETDAFLALCLWTHLKPGGILIFDDLDWVPAAHGTVDVAVARPTTAHIKVLFDYIKTLPDVDQARVWGGNELSWNWGFIRKRGPGISSLVGIEDSPFISSEPITDCSIDG